MSTTQKSTNGLMCQENWERTGGMFGDTMFKQFEQKVGARVECSQHTKHPALIATGAEEKNLMARKAKDRLAR